MKHTRNIFLVLAAVVALASSSFASEISLVIKSSKLTKVLKVSERTSKWVVDAVPPDTYTISFVNENGIDITTDISASVFVKGFMGNSRSSSVDIAAFGFTPVELSSARTATGKSFSLSSASELSITVSSLSVSNVLKTRHETAKNSIGNIR